MSEDNFFVMPQPSAQDANITLKVPSLHVPRVVSRKNRFASLHSSNIPSPLETSAHSTQSKDTDSIKQILNLKASDALKSNMSYLKVSSIPKKDLSLDEALVTLPSETKKVLHSEMSVLPAIFRSNSKIMKKRNASAQIKTKYTASKNVHSENNSFEVSKHFETRDEINKKLPQIMILKEFCNDSISDSLLDTTQRDTTEFNLAPKYDIDREKGYLNVRGVRMKYLNLAGAGAERNSPSVVAFNQYPIVKPAAPKENSKEYSKTKILKECIKFKVKDTPQKRMFDHVKFQVIPKKQLVNVYELVKRLNENKMRFN